MSEDDSEDVHIYKNQMEKKWCVNHPEGAEFYSDYKKALKGGRKLAKHYSVKMVIHRGEENVEVKDYS